MRAGKKKESVKNAVTDTYQYISCPSGNVLYVEMEGPENGLPILLIHGLNSSRLQWFYQRQRLKEKYRLFMIDLPGHGRSHGAQDLSVAGLAKDLQAILTELAIVNPIRYGHRIAFWYA